MNTPETWQDHSSRQQKDKLRRLALISLVVAVILGGGFVAARPAYRAFQGWRSKLLAAQAEKLAGENHWAEAGEKAQAAFLLNRAEPTALHAMARTLTAATNAAALQFWHQLILTGHASQDDRRAFIDLAIRLGAPGQAGNEMLKLLAEAPNQPVNLWLASQLFAALGSYPETLNYATRAALHDPDNKQYQLFLSSLRFDSTDFGQRTEARSNVWTLARETTRIGLDALNFLAGRQDHSDDQRRELIALLKQHPLAGTSQHLMALDHRLRLEPKLRAEMLDQAVAQYKTADAATLVQFVVWLNQHEEFQRTLSALPLSAALVRKELFIPHLDALASLGRWEEVDTILDTKQIPLEPVYYEGFRARCAMQLGRGLSADLHWNSAWQSAERNPEQLTWLSLYAEKCGAWGPAKKAYRSLIACAANVRPAYQALQQLTLKSGTTAELGDLMDEMLKRWPKDPALRNDHAYLNLLLSKELAGGRQTAEELVTQFPDLLPYRTTLALACYRLKDYPAALRAYEGHQYDWRQALPGNRAVYAAVLAANGKTSEAREQAHGTARNQLRDEEFDLIRSLF